MICIIDLYVSTALEKYVHLCVYYNILHSVCNVNSLLASVLRIPIVFVLESCFPYWFYINLKSKLSFVKKLDFKIPDVNARAPSSEPVESGSDTDRDEARMAAEMVGGRTWLGEWFSTESETSGHQVGLHFTAKCTRSC